LWLKSESFRIRIKTGILTSCSVATGYGQPPSTIYDWALEPASLKAADYRLPEDLKVRLRIEKFCDRVTRSLYNGRPEPSEFISMEKLLLVGVLEDELREMELDFTDNISRRLLTLLYALFLNTNILQKSI
jgi:hypothetical protein